MARVLITGCSSPKGIGFATARRLAQAGHDVVATVRHHEHDADLTADRAGLSVESMDLLDRESISRVVDAVTGRQGGIDVLINNAGYGLIGGIEQCSIQQARAVFDTDYFGTIELVRAVLPGMREQGHGHIVSVSSIFVPTLTPIALGHYVATKAALETALEALAGEAADFGIRITNVQPGPVDTELSREWARPENDPRPTLSDELYEWVGSAPGLEMESPEAVAEAIATLLASADPPLAAQTTRAGEAWVARALRDPSRRSEPLAAPRPDRAPR